MFEIKKEIPVQVLMVPLCVRFLLLCSVAFLTAAFVISSHASKFDSSVLEYPMTTKDRVHDSGWWPTKGTPAREEFVGEAVCAKCHSNEAASWASTPMAHASMLPQDSAVLQEFPSLNFRQGPYSYNILSAGEKWSFSVTDGKDSITETILWAFGFNHKGQAYVLKRNGAFYDSRLNFYNTLLDLDITTGHPRSVPANLEAAVGRRMGTYEASHCFGCHTTASTTDNQFDPDHSALGVACEACHGPGAKHVAAMKTGKIELGRRTMFNPAALGPIASVDFCGACHRTWADVLEAGTRGVLNVRFQPYRLERSSCWGKGNTRLTCVTCHNPHEPIVRGTAAYDEKCLACHVTRGMQTSRDHPGKACPKDSRACVTCHMRSAEIPSMHSSFTDHFIRIAREGETFPD